MSYRLNPEAHEGLIIAAEEARIMTTNIMNTGHLFIGMTSDERSSASLLLVKLGFDVDELRSQVLRQIDYRGEMLPDDSPVFLDGGTMHALSVSRGLRSWLSVPRVSPAMTLFGIVNSRGPGYDVLDRAGLKPKQIQAGLFAATL